MGKENKTRYALLGMLSLGSMSGYDLKKMIAQSTGDFWHESYPQIYPMLKQLTQEGLAISSVERQAGRPERNVYTITERGWDVLKNWMSEPFEYQKERNELLLKVFFGALTSTTVSIEHVRRHRAFQEEQIARLMQTEDQITDQLRDHPDLPYWHLTIRYGLYIARAQLSWCDEAITTLAALPGQPPERP
jgi:PadR family transcriptional regulator, regulatory protein AphA